MKDSAIQTMVRVRSTAVPIAYRLQRALTSRRAIDAYGGLAIVGVIAGVIFGIVFAKMAHARGNYAGQHYGSARRQAIDVMAHRYGGVLAVHLRLGKPDVLNTHLPNNVLIGNEQVRVFHLIGPKGVKYCVRIWASGSIGAEANAVVKGCKF